MASRDTSDIQNNNLTNKDTKLPTLGTMMQNIKPAPRHEW